MWLSLGAHASSMLANAFWIRELHLEFPFFAIPKSEQVREGMMPSPVRMMRALPRTAMPRLRILTSDCVPVHDIPPCLEIVGTAILVFEIIRMFPHVDAQNRRIAVHQ